MCQCIPAPFPPPPSPPSSPPRPSFPGFRGLSLLVPNVGGGESGSVLPVSQHRESMRWASTNMHCFLRVSGRSESLQGHEKLSTKRLRCCRHGIGLRLYRRVRRVDANLPAGYCRSGLTRPPSSRLRIAGLGHETTRGPVAAGKLSDVLELHCGCVGPALSNWETASAGAMVAVACRGYLCSGRRDGCAGTPCKPVAWGNQLVVRPIERRDKIRSSLFDL